MKVSLICIYSIFLILFIIPFLNANDKKLITDSDEFEEINSFLQIHSEQSQDLYLLRLSKLRKKKEIIIKKIYSIIPFVGEILGLCSIEKIDLIVNKFFLEKETDLFIKYITMWDVNSNFIKHSAKVMLNIILCNNKFNRLRCILNLLMEGLCQGDDRSIRIFKEIVITVIIDTLIKTKFYYYNDIQAKYNLISLFNKGFIFKPITKIHFINKLMISDKLKELITFCKIY